MTPERIEELRGLCDAATPGPWALKPLRYGNNGFITIFVPCGPTTECLGERFGREDVAKD